MTLIARDLAYRYAMQRTQTLPAISEISMVIRPGEVVAVVGPNGSGKSTLMAVLAGWLQPASGTVELDGKDLQRWPARARARRVAYLPQQVAPLYDLSSAEVVAAGRHPHRSLFAGAATHDHQVVERVLAATDASHLESRPFSTLSGGERQRVLVASILAQEPGILLLDEPTAALDLHHRVEVFRLLRTAASSGRGVAAVTHDLNLASLFADRVVLLDGGRLVAEGPPGVVLKQEILERAYGPELLVVVHPAAACPAILPAAGESE